MKKLILIAITILSITSINAQVDSTKKVDAVAPRSSKPKFSPAIRITPALCWFNSEAVGANKDKFTVNREGFGFGINYGLMLDYMFTENYGFSFELKLMNIFGGGFSYTERTDPLNVNSIKNQHTYSFRNSYLEVPVSFKMMTNEIGYMRYFAQIGVAPVITTKGRMNSSDNISDGVRQSDGVSLKAKEVIRGYNLNLIAGAGAEYNLTDNTSILLGLSYNSGIFDLSKNENFIIRSRYLALNLGIKF